ncbi:response regulator transcription factor [Megasphaera sp.]|uniref:response regulator transcription factor n=1 Tax=Megasphaera TaxID=906 RepID=UPI001DD81305|nr:response regulator transcription factor [Megasphaera sp.]MBS6789603.1 response regulator transcription factor [Megasphaera sp.]
MRTNSILIVDDDEKLCVLLRSYFEQEQFIVYVAHDGTEALNLLRSQKPQIMLLDLMMPGMDGFEVCRRTRQFSDIPIIFLSAKDDETDRLVGLNIGGDDYVTKPFHVKEIIARVYSLLRRTRGEVLQQTTSYRVRDLTIDKEKFTVLRGGQPIVLTPTEFGLLEVLASSPDRVFSRMQLMDKIQGGYSFEGYERTIDTHIRNLRKKLEPNPAQPSYIQTVYGIGYKFVGGGHEAV